MFHIFYCSPAPVHKTHEVPTQVPVVVAPVEPEPIIYDNRAYIQEEPVHVQQVETRRTVETEPVHVQYAMVQKRPQYITHDDDDMDAIVTEIRDDDRPGEAVYEPEEYRIETEVVAERF